MRRSRYWLRVVSGLTLLCAGEVAAAQSTSATAALEHGSLTVWVVSPATAVEKQRLAAQQQAATVNAVLSAGLQQQTAGSFGRASSDVGQTAGSYGQTSSSSGRNASDTGLTAGSYGVTTSGLGTASSNVGTTAGNYGQTSSSFPGLSSDGTAPAQQVVAVGRLEAGFEADLRQHFHNLQVIFVRVSQEELASRLDSTDAERYPDVLMGSLPDGSNTNALVLRTVAWPVFGQMGRPPAEAVQGVNTSIPSWLSTMPLAVMRRAPHPDAARAFVVWFRDEDACRLCDESLGRRRHVVKRNAEDMGMAVSTARAALLRVLSGSRLGELADADAAGFDGAWTKQLALVGYSESVPDALDFRVDVMSAEANERLAVVTLRAIVSGADAFGVAHALVVLRKDGAGRWKVLQLSPNLTPQQLLRRTGALEEFAVTGSPAAVVGISQAAPVDGDNRQSKPDLWWDNGGGAGLLVVEWQSRVGSQTGALGATWAGSQMMMVPDKESRVQTRVAATFATAGDYRWRVWAVGNGGVIVLSSWRSLHILP